MIADYREGQTLVETLLGNGIHQVALTDWKSATIDMKDLDIDSYLAELVVAIDMGATTLKENWPEIARWIASQYRK